MNIVLSRAALAAIAGSLLALSTAAGPAWDHREAIGSSTYLGGMADDGVNDAVVDGSGFIYLTGTTHSADFPVQAAMQAQMRGTADAFVTKLTPNADAVVFSTFLGGTQEESGWGIDVDESGNIYVVGSTYSTDFPVRNPIMTDPADGLNDAFVAKISSDGSEVLYATYLGGAFTDEALAISIGSSGSAFVAGRTSSSDFPTTERALQPVVPEGGDCGSGQCRNAFIARLAPDGGSLEYSTFLGGSGNEEPDDIEVDADGHAFATGWTTSTDFPTRDAAQNQNRGGEDVFVTKLSDDGSRLEYSTYLGGARNDRGYEIEVLPGGIAYVAGWAGSDNIPTVNALQPSFGGGESDVILAALASTGSTFLFVTYFGGNELDDAYGLAVDAEGRITLTGITFSPNFPTRFPFDDTLGEFDAYVVRLAPGASSLLHSSFLGGAGGDVGSDVARAPDGHLSVVVGATLSTDFPLAAPLQSANGGRVDGFVTVLPDVAAAPEVSGVQASARGTPFKLKVSGAHFQPGVSVYIGDDASPWGKVTVKKSELVIIKGGGALKSRFPKNEAITIRLVNPDGGETTTSFTR